MHKKTWKHKSHDHINIVIKASDNIPNAFMIKILDRRGNVPQYNILTYREHHHKWRKKNAWSNLIEIRKKIGISTIPTPFPYWTWSTHLKNKAREGNYSYKIRKKGQNYPHLQLKYCVQEVPKILPEIF